ncbi:MAG: hypothetical protein PGN33_14165 [Methylobacterium radiotolerans]
MSDEAPVTSWRDQPEPNRKRQETAISAATQSCEADGNKCSCKEFGWQQFNAEPRQCNARLSAAYETLKLVNFA